jgi:hypothetical protein
VEVEAADEFKGHRSRALHGRIAGSKGAVRPAAKS